MRSEIESTARARYARVLLAGAGGAAVLLAGAATRPALAVTGAVQNPADGHWYLYVESGGADWAACRDLAETEGGYLASVGSQGENDWIVQHLGMSASAPAWLGGTDESSEGAWQWRDGETWSYANWAPSEPSDVSGTENWLAMAADGTWTDESPGTAVVGYVVEWDQEPGDEPTTPPAAPSNLVASYAAGAGVALTWNDASVDESGFRVERQPAGFAFSQRHLAEADAKSFTDYSLVPATTYSYRVVAFNAAGDSPPSSEVTVTTSASEALPAPPAAPSSVAAAVTGSHAVEVTWTDSSDDETLFEIERAAGGTAFVRAATRPAGSESYADGAVHPGWPYVYRVRALGLQGPSARSQPVVITVPATLDVSMTSGTLKRVAKPGRDSIKVRGAFVRVEGTDDAPFDPVALGLEIQVGPPTAPIVVSVPSNDPRWKVEMRRGVAVAATWKSPKGASPKAAVSVDLVRATYTIAATGADLGDETSTSVRLLLACGPQCGAAGSAWTPGKPGVLRLQ